MYCIAFPNAKNGQPSQLWRDLTDKYQNRDIVKELYISITSDSFLEQFGDSLIYDKNGEPTIESVDMILEGQSFDNKEAQRVKFENQLNSKSYPNTLDMIKDVVKFNDKNSDFVAEITQIGDNHQIHVRHMTSSDAQVKEQLRNSLDVYNKIANILNKFGVSLNILDANLLHQEDAIMMPENMNNTTNGLFGVINLANNLKGFNALTEEFSHFLCEILSDNPVIQRAERLLEQNPEFVESILGEDYDDVVSYYTNKNRTDLIVKEALGRLVSRIINHDLTERVDPLFNRSANTIENFIYNAFRFKNNTQASDIIHMIHDLSNVVNEFMKQDQIDSELVQHFKKFGNTLAHTKSTITSLKEKHKNVLDKSEARLLKFLNVYGDSDQGLSSDIKEAFLEIFEKRQADKLIDASLSFFQHITDILEKNLGALKALDLNPNMSLYDIRHYAHELMTLKNLWDCSREPCMDIRHVLQEIYQDKSLNLTDEEAQTLEKIIKDVSPKCLAMLNDVESDFLELNKKVVEIFAKPYFGDGTGEIKVPGKEGQEGVITLESVLSASDGDISFLSRMLQSAANTNDLFIGLVNNILDHRNEEIRFNTLAIDHKIQEMDRRYRNSGMYKGTSHIYERDENGQLTGNLVSDVKLYKWERERKAEKKRLDALYKDENDNVDEEKVQKGMDLWDLKHSKKIHTVKSKSLRQNVSSQAPPNIREYLGPNPDLYKNLDFQKGWNQAQIEYYNSYMELKKSVLDWMLPEYKTHPYRAIQMMVASTGEAILNSDSGFMGGVKNVFKSMYDNYFSITENDEGEYYDGTRSKVGKYIDTLRKKYNKQDDSNETSAILKFDNTPYKEIPTYFLNSLKDMSKLSTDGTSALREYNIMANHYYGMHQMLDIIELIRELNKNRKINNTTKFKQLVEKGKRRINGKLHTYEIDSTIPTEATNVYNRVNELIDMKVFKQNKLQGTTIIGDLTSGKAIDNMIKLTSFSLLGYSAFSGINNVVVAKYQMWIEAMGGEYFTVKDWLAADKEYIKMAPEMFAELRLPYTTSKMGLLGEFFNIGQNWKSHIQNSKAYRNNTEQFLANFGPSCLLESGEHAIQMSTGIAIMKNYKLYEGPITRDAKGKITNKSVSLFDAIEKVDKKDENGKVIDAELRLKEKYANYVKEDGNKFEFRRNSNDVKKLALLIGKVNQDMHGIYNQEDAAVLTRYALGRMVMLFRKHMVPQLQKRYKGLGKYKAVYDYRSGKWEEGYITTLLRFSKDVTKSIFNFTDESDLGKQTQLQVLWNSLSKYEKNNLKKAVTEIASLVALVILCALLSGADWDDDEWAKRHVYYFAQRLKLEATFPYSINSAMDILISPSATISQLQRYTRLAQSIGRGDEILQSGPYAGHSVLYANLMRALPVYPQVYDFINIDDDNHRFQVFTKDKSLIERVFFE